jgi:hypothetical protein
MATKKAAAGVGINNMAARQRNNNIGIDNVNMAPQLMQCLEQQ